MDKISRSTFLKLSALGAAGIARPGGFWDFSVMSVDSHSVDSHLDEALLARVIKSSDLLVERYLASFDFATQRGSYRSLSNALASCTAAYCHPDSRYHRSGDVLQYMENIMDKLLEVQHPNGTMDAGGNRQSPPDTAFYLEQMCPAAGVLRRAKIEASELVREKLEAFLIKAGEGIRTGGVHTPNHRWVVAAALAHLYSLFGDEKYVVRMDQWLADGIYQNEDGNYPERSRNYSIVENNAFLTIGRLMGRPELFDIVKRNLEANYYYMEPNGELITLDSRRQDQNYTLEMARYYFQYKFLAHHYNDDFLAAIAQKIEEFDGFETHVLSKLVVFMDEPVLLEKLSTDVSSADSALPVNYVKVFPASSLVRIRRGDVTASIFGGNDKPIVIASGRSVNPTFFTFRKGNAVLNAVRLSTSYFNTGYVRSDGVVRNGNQYILSERKEAYYYHPMPADKRDAAGDYNHSPSLDDRFWSKMDFESRPKDTVLLESRIELTEENGAFTMDIDIDGPEGVRVILEFGFARGGELEGVTPGPAADDYFLESGMATYTYGDDLIEIGPGINEHKNLRGQDGEMYSTHFGSIKGSGMHVYLTGMLPFKHSLTIK